jgi:phosphatidylglycerol:prolipoprotein diacylglycerol transferase
VTANLTEAEKARIQTFKLVSKEGFGVRFPSETGAFKQHHRLGLIPHHASSSLPVHPVQLYEALMAFALVAGLQWRRSKPHVPGGLFCAFGVGYGVIRFVLEFLRADNSPAYLGLTLSQVISVLIIGVFLPLLLYCSRGTPLATHAVPGAAGQLAPR